MSVAARLTSTFKMYYISITLAHISILKAVLPSARLYPNLMLDESRSEFSFGDKTKIV